MMDICKSVTVMFLAVVLYSVQASAQGGSGQAAMACLQKLLPCRPYLHTVNPPPPETCCVPMKEIVEKDPRCLCTAFNNPEMLKMLNITKENALDLPKACGANPDVSLCTKTASTSPAASPESTNGGSSLQDVSFVGLGFVSAFVAIILF